MTRIAILGGSGMLGRETVELFTKQRRVFHSFERAQIDASMDASRLITLLDGFDVVVNCVAYTAVDKAESEFEAAKLVNGTFPGELAKATSALNARLFHYSTDYVFDGKANKPYLPGHSRNPINSYGRTKAIGEELIESHATSFTIMRTAWLYGEYGRCFPKTIKSLLETRPSVSIVHDQSGQPTWARDVALLTGNLIDSTPSYSHVHATSAGFTTWFGFAQQIANSLGAGYSGKLVPVPSTDFLTPAARPSFSVLDNDALPDALRIEPWDKAWAKAAPQVL